MWPTEFICISNPVLEIQYLPLKYMGQNMRTINNFTHVLIALINHTKAPVLKFYNERDEATIQCDASDNGIILTNVPSN